MDLLVVLCAEYHLNPSRYTLELVTTNSKNTKLKPNALIGTLDVEKILLKPKGEDKNKKTGPQMPEVCGPPGTAFSLFSKCIDDADIFGLKQRIFCSPGNRSDGDKLQEDTEDDPSGQPSGPPGRSPASYL